MKVPRFLSKATLYFFRIVGLIFGFTAFAQFQDNFIVYGFVSIGISTSILFLTFWYIPRKTLQVNND